MAITQSNELGVLVVGHGTREPAGIDEFWDTCRAVAAAEPSLLVEGAFLEFAAPTIAEGFESLVNRGAEQIVVLPLLLFSAGHAKRDIPAAVADATRQYPQIAVALACHLGCHPSIIALSRQRFAEALSAPGPVAADQTVHILVGRGSHDADATAEMHALARLRAAQGDACRVEVAFMSMAQPPLTDVLQQVSEMGARRVIVQPHLLFGGLLVERMRGMVADFALCNPRVEWLLAGQLGPSELLVRAVLDRARAAETFAAAVAGATPGGL